MLLMLELLKLKFMNFRSKWDFFDLIVLHPIPNVGKMRFRPAIFIKMVFGPHFCFDKNGIIALNGPGAKLEGGMGGVKPPKIRIMWIGRASHLYWQGNQRF